MTKSYHLNSEFDKVETSNVIKCKTPKAKADKKRLNRVARAKKRQLN